MKKVGLTLLLIMVVGMLAACSGTATATQAAAASDTSASDSQLNSMLAVGTIKLEGTDQAVTAEQAATLLPLWKGINVLSSSDTVTTAEIQAVYRQIREAMTAEQLQAISAMNLTQDDLSALMEQYGLNNIVSETTSDSSGSSGFSGFSGFPGGGDMPSGGMPSGGSMPSGGDMPSGDMGSGAMGGDMAGGMMMSGTPQANVTPGAGMGGGMMMMNSTLFVEPLIEILSERAG